MKRITTLLLAFVLVLALVPAIALADDPVYDLSVSLADPAKVWKAGDTVATSDLVITLTKDGTKVATTTTLSNETLTLPDGMIEATQTVKATVETLTETPKYTEVVDLPISFTGKLTALTSDIAAVTGYTGHTASEALAGVRFFAEVDGKNIEVVPEYGDQTFSGAGTVSITASFELGGTTKTCTVDVNVAASLSALVVEGAPDEAYIDDATNEGIRVTAQYADGRADQDITERCTFTPDFYTSLGNQVVNVAYEEDGVTLTESFTAAVVDKCTNLTLSATKTDAYVGDKPQFTATATFADGSEKDVTADCTVSPTEFTTDGSIAVTVTYQDSANATAISKSFTVEVEALPELTATLTVSGDILVGDPMRDSSDKPVFKVEFAGSEKDADGNYYFDVCTMEPATKNFNKAGEQVYTFRYSDPKTGKDYVVKTAPVTVLEPIQEFKVEGTVTKNYAGEIFDPVEMPGLTYTVTYRTSAITGQKAGTDIAAATDWGHERIKWTQNKKLAFGTNNNEITFSFTDPLTSNALYYNVTISGLSVIDSVSVNGAPRFFNGETFREDLLRSIDKLGVTISVKYVDKKYGEDFTISSSTDPKLSNVSIPNVKFEDGASGSEQIVFTDSKSGSFTKSNAVSYVAEPMVYEHEYDAAHKTTAPIWVSNRFSKTSYSEGEKISPAGLQLVLTNFWGQKKTVTEGFTYKIRTKKIGNTPAQWKDEDYSVNRPLKPTDDYAYARYNFLGTDGQYHDVTFDRAYVKSTGKLGNAGTALYISERVLSKIVITTAPKKVDYEIGEALDTTGMVVTAYYTNGSKEEVSAYTIDCPETFTKNHVGTYKVKVDFSYKTVTKSAELVVTVKGPKVPSQSVVLNKAMLELVQGTKETLVAMVYPTNASNKNVTWTTSDAAVATVSEDGEVKAVGAGTCLISATTMDYTHRYADCYVTVSPKTSVTKLTPNHTSLELLKGDATTLTVTMTPDNATARAEDVEWTSSDPSVVSVGDDGQIKGLKTGDAVITAEVDGVTTHCSVSVVSSLNGYGTVYNCSKSVNVRKTGSTSGAVIGSAPKGKTYKVLGKSSDGKWYKIQYSSSKVGYIYKDYLKVSDKAYTVDSSESEQANNQTTIIATKLTIVNCQRYIYVRKGPSTSTSSLGHASAGSTYSLLGMSGDWYIINFNGQQGYVSSAFAQIS
ncbi:MAG: SH3 domain-containing protein [Clostridia bacterium]|nr:SH3 domain-containing protein [Clostridia bacterium]